MGGSARTPRADLAQANCSTGDGPRAGRPARGALQFDRCAPLCGSHGTPPLDLPLTPHGNGCAQTGPGMGRWMCGM
jgi:hypothetical protein